jgi:hypothetical protein
VAANGEESRDVGSRLAYPRPAAEGGGSRWGSGAVVAFAVTSATAPWSHQDVRSGFEVVYFQRLDAVHERLSSPRASPGATIR